MLRTTSTSTTSLVLDAGMFPMFLAKVELKRIVTCVPSQYKFNSAELFGDREACCIAADGRNSAARQVAFVWMSITSTTATTTTTN